MLLIHSALLLLASAQGSQSVTIDVVEGAVGTVVTYPSKTKIVFQGEVKDAYETTYTLYVDGRMFSEAPQTKRWKLTLDTAALKGSKFEIKITKYRPSVGRSDVASFTVILADGIGRSFSGLKLTSDGGAQLELAGEASQPYKLRVFVNGAMVAEGLPGEGSVKLPKNSVRPGANKVRGEAVTSTGVAFPIAEQTLDVASLATLSLDGPRSLEVNAKNAKTPLKATVSPVSGITASSTELLVNGEPRKEPLLADLPYGENILVGRVKTPEGGVLDSPPVVVTVVYETEYATLNAAPIVYRATATPNRRTLRRMCAAGGVTYENLTLDDLTPGAWELFVEDAERSLKSMPAKIPDIPKYSHAVKLIDLLEENRTMAIGMLRFGKNIRVTRGDEGLVRRAEDEKVFLDMAQHCVRGRDDVIAIFASVAKVDAWMKDNKALLPEGKPLTTPELTTFSSNMEILSQRHRLLTLLEETVRHSKVKPWELRLKAMSDFRVRMVDQRNVQVGTAASDLFATADALIARYKAINAKKDLQEERVKLARDENKNLESRTRIAEIDRDIEKLRLEFVAQGEEAIRRAKKAGVELGIELDGIEKFLPSDDTDFVKA